MAGEDKKFSEDEMALLLADRVAKETADLTAERDTLKAERDELQNKLDVEMAAKVAAEQKVAEIEAEFATFKDGLAELAAANERKDERLAKVKEVAAHLGDDFLADENRVARIVAMDEDLFEGYVADLKAAAPAGATTTVVPRESAMTGESPASPSTVTAARAVLLSRYETSKEG